MRRCWNRTHQKGMTLVETLIALALIGAVVGGMAFFFSRSSQNINLLKVSQRRAQIIRELESTLNSPLAMYVTSTKPGTGNSALSSCLRGGDGCAKGVANTTPLSLYHEEGGEVFVEEKGTQWNLDHGDCKKEGVCVLEAFVSFRTSAPVPPKTRPDTLEVTYELKTLPNLRSLSADTYKRTVLLDLERLLVAPDLRSKTRCNAGELEIGAAPDGKALCARLPVSCPQGEFLDALGLNVGGQGVHVKCTRVEDIACPKGTFLAAIDPWADTTIGSSALLRMRPRCIPQPPPPQEPLGPPIAVQVGSSCTVITKGSKGVCPAGQVLTGIHMVYKFWNGVGAWLGLADLPYQGQCCPVMAK